MLQVENLSCRLVVIVKSTCLSVEAFGLRHICIWICHDEDILTECGLERISDILDVKRGYKLFSTVKNSVPPYGQSFAQPGYLFFHIV